MARFLTELDLECCTSDAYWCLISPLVYESDLITVPVRQDQPSDVFPGSIVVPIGFVTDLASVPLHIKWAHREGVLHDYLYRSDAVPAVSFAQANAIFYEAMLSRGKKWWVRWGMWLGVWIGGWWSYHTKPVSWKPKGEKP